MDITKEMMEALYPVLEETFTLANKQDALFESDMFELADSALMALLPIIELEVSRKNWERDLSK